MAPLARSLPSPCPFRDAHPMTAPWSGPAQWPTATALTGQTPPALLAGNALAPRRISSDDIIIVPLIPSCSAEADDDRIHPSRGRSSTSDQLSPPCFSFPSVVDYLDMVHTRSQTASTAIKTEDEASTAADGRAASASHADTSSPAMPPRSSTSHHPSTSCESANVSVCGRRRSSRRISSQELARTTAESALFLSPHSAVAKPPRARTTPGSGRKGPESKGKGKTKGKATARAVEIRAALEQAVSAEDGVSPILKESTSSTPLWAKSPAAQAAHSAFADDATLFTPADQVAVRTAATTVPSTRQLRHSCRQVSQNITPSSSTIYVQQPTRSIMESGTVDQGQQQLRQVAIPNPKAVMIEVGDVMKTYLYKVRSRRADTIDRSTGFAIVELFSEEADHSTRVKELGRVNEKSA